MLAAPNSGSGDPWGAVRVSDFSVAQTAHALSLSELWLPGSPAAHKVEVVSLNVVGGAVYMTGTSWSYRSVH